MYENEYAPYNNARDAYDAFDQFLDEMYGPVEIAGLEYDTARVLKNIDPTAYACGFTDWLDGEQYPS